MTRSLEGTSANARKRGPVIGIGWNEMSRQTLFSWGYWGWGNATEQLVEAVDAVETSRGYQPRELEDT
jgi:hypothetical protein